MRREQLPHLIINKSPEVSAYTTTLPGRGKSKIPPREDRATHGQRIKEKFKKAWEEFEKLNEQRTAVSFADIEGINVEFKSKAGFDLVIKSLEDIRQGIRLLNVQKSIKDGYEITKATIFIPNDKIQSFLKKIDDYLTEDKVTKRKDGTIVKKPKNANLIESIEDIRLAVLDSFWNDKKELIPATGTPDWCEVWIRADSKNDETENHFFNLCSSLNIEYKENQVLFFPECKVVVVKADRENLKKLITFSSRIAEIRLVKETASFWINTSPKEQSEWCQNLKDRLSVDKESKVCVCVLDTGVNNGHILLEDIIEDKHCHTIKTEWGTHDSHGHGTLMCGTVTFGDLQKCLDSQNEISILHSVESVKLLRKPGHENEKDLYGELTKRSVSYPEIEEPEKKRVICLAITSDKCEEGKPSSWSGAIDQLSSGQEDEQKRLFIISAGNVRDENCWKAYPDSNITCYVQDPAQSWNALTVGAYTEKDLVTDPNLKNSYTALAKKGELSPFSSTSSSWDNEWPIKPDIVMEGGNLAKDNFGLISETEDLSLFSLSNEIRERQFDIINATSAATAQASWMAAQIQLNYTEFWPETIRALMVHSAEWTEQLKKQFYDKNKTEKENYKKLLRICGYGVPNLGKALYSANNSLTLISENYIQPYYKNSGKKPQTKDMHLYELPWPKEALKNLPAEAIVKLKITLSYFIEPSPSNKGWANKYRYQSHALRFDLKNPWESSKEFLKRINKQAREEDEKIESSGQRIKWKLGPKIQTSGSIHSDTWEGFASDLANCNFVAVYPVIGWWKERTNQEKWDSVARYSIIISLETPETKIDLYTPVEILLKTPIPIENRFKRIK